MDSKVKHNLIHIILAIVVCLVIVSIPLAVKLVADNIEDNDEPETDTHPEVVSITIEIGCHRLFEEGGQKYHADIEERLGTELFEALGEGDMVALETLTLPYGATVMDATKRVLSDHGISIAASDEYISAIGGLAEKMAGNMSGWVYTINGKKVMAGASKLVLKEGDRVTWIYLVD